MFNLMLILISTVSVKFSKKSLNKMLQFQCGPRIARITQPPHLQSQPWGVARPGGRGGHSVRGFIL